MDARWEVRLIYRGTHPEQSRVDELIRKHLIFHGSPEVKGMMTPERLQEQIPADDFEQGWEQPRVQKEFVLQASNFPDEEELRSTIITAPGLFHYPFADYVHTALAGLWKDLARHHPVVLWAHVNDYYDDILAKDMEYLLACVIPDEARSEGTVKYARNVFCTLMRRPRNFWIEELELGKMQVSFGDGRPYTMAQLIR